MHRMKRKQGKKLYGMPTLLTLLLAFTALVIYRFSMYPGRDRAFFGKIPFDLKIYQMAGKDLKAGGQLYDAPYIHEFPFTYPPFAGWFFEWMADFSDHDLMVIWQWVTGIALFIVIMLVIRERGYRLGPLTWLVGIALLVSSLAAEPINGTFYYGQINILLMFLVSLDLLLPTKLRLPGIGIGIAAGMKLTPAYMGLALLFQKRWWAAIGSIAAFAVTIGIGVAFVPDAMDFWTDKIFNSNRIGEVDAPGAKSLRSVLARLTGEDDTALWLLGVAIIVMVTMLALRTAWIRKNSTAAFALTGLSACLVSPFSWYHHFVWVVPFGIWVMLAVNEAIGTRLRTVWGAQLAAVASFLALLIVELPFVAAPVWLGGSSRTLDALETFQPLASLVWPLACFLYIAVYAIWGFMPQKRTTELDAAPTTRIPTVRVK